MLKVHSESIHVFPYTSMDKDSVMFKLIIIMYFSRKLASDLTGGMELWVQNYFQPLLSVGIKFKTIKWQTLTWVEWWVQHQMIIDPASQLPQIWSNWFYSSRIDWKQLLHVSLSRHLSHWVVSGMLPLSHCMLKKCIALYVKIPMKI